MFPTKIYLIKFLQVTDNYGCMVINNRLRSSDIEKVFWYKKKKNLKQVKRYLLLSTKIF